MTFSNKLLYQPNKIKHEEKPKKIVATPVSCSPSIIPEVRNKIFPAINAKIT